MARAATPRNGVFGVFYVFDLLVNNLRNLCLSLLHTLRCISTERKSQAKTGYSPMK
jgi:hypothetical protein